MKRALALLGLGMLACTSFAQTVVPWWETKRCDGLGTMLGLAFGTAVAIDGDTAEVTTQWQPNSLEYTGQAHMCVRFPNGSGS